MTSRGWSTEQTSRRLIRDALRETLRQARWVAPGAAGGIDSTEGRATAVLYTLLLQHPIDHRGRCRSCRSAAGAMIGLRRCRVHVTANDWLLLQPDRAALLSHLAHELGLGTAPPPGASPPDRSLLTIKGWGG